MRAIGKERDKQGEKRMEKKRKKKPLPLTTENAPAWSNLH